jgi:hypothetical protein
MSTTVRTALAVAAILIGAAVLWDAPAPAQIPDTFTNLEVLPKDIGKRELVGFMREMTGGLGVRCNYCHVGESTTSLEGFDFASDEKEHKRIARVMIRMTQEIHGTLIPKTGIESPVRVQCITCHHGVTKPQTLDHLLLGVIEKDGVPAAEARYRELRAEYYGAAAYDFGAWTLGEVAQTLAGEKENVNGAISVMKLNLEFNPEDAPSHLLMGQLYAQKGDREAAAASVERCLELDPGNEWAQRTLEQIRGGKK